MGVASPAFGADDVSFAAQVAPILVQKCQGCHGPEKAKGHYRLDTFDRLTRPGDAGGAPVVPGEPGKSELVMRITSHDPEKRMPQKDDPLPAEQVALVERWVKSGAKFDGPDRTAPLATFVPAARQPHPAAPQAYPRPVPVLALAFSPDGETLAASGYHEVTLWRPGDGRLVRRVGNVARQTHALAYSPDGSLLAVAGGTPGTAGEVRLVRADGASESAAQPPRLLDRIGDVMPCVAFSPDGTRLAAGGADGAVCVYDMASGKRLLRVELHADWVTAVAFSPDGSRVASASRDKSARVIDAKTGEAIGAYPGHGEPVFAVAWSADGRRVYSGGKDRELHLWEPAAEAKKLAEAGGFGGDVLRLLAGGESVFACAADGKVRQFTASGDKPAFKLVRTFDGAADWAYALAVDVRNNRLAVGGFDGTVRLFSVDDARELSRFVAAPGVAKVNPPG